MKKAKPFLKWVGGKRQLLKEIRALYPFEKDREIIKYAEPFVGGGAVLFDILNQFELPEIYISDVNAELINTYIMVRDHVDALIDVLKNFEEEYLLLDEAERKKVYKARCERFNELKMRREINSNSAALNVELAALMIFLNRTCFNGVYRVNRQGKFNVPMGRYKNPVICDAENLRVVSEKLQNVKIVCGSYEKSADFIDEKTFVYFDPPYRPLTKTANFTSYTENSFGDAEQIKLAQFVQKLDKKGAKILISNSDPKNVDKNDDFFDDIYRAQMIERVSATRMINSDSRRRTNASELLIRNYSFNQNQVKRRGKIYTPDYLVKIILDRGGYTGPDILQKHVIDNSCGNGQFMVHVVDRYCEEYLKISDDKDGLKKELEKYIHAIEIEREDLDVCKKRCDEIAYIYGIKNIEWDFVNNDATKIDKFDGKMDFVVGNPPYVRIHNLSESAVSVKKHLFCKNGMTDLYILFYEIGIKMLSDTGTLAYITPSSFFTSLAGLEMRRYLTKRNLLTSVCDLKHFQAFNSTTYTTIICLKNNNDKSSVSYAEFDAKTLRPVEISTLNKKDYLIDNKFYFSDKDSLKLLSSVIGCDRNYDFAVKNGYATLADEVFINDFDFESKFIIPVVKASRAKWTKIFYPYDKNGKLCSEDELYKDANIKAYLSERKEQLLKRANEKDHEQYWYAFGRSQAINDTYKDKLALNTLIKTAEDIKLVEAKKGTGVYSGLYVVSNSIPLKKIRKILESEDFCKYVSLLGKYKSGGYYTYSSKDVTSFIKYKLSKKES